MTLLHQAAQKAVEALKLADGALCQASPCMWKDCKQEQMEWLAAARESIATNLAALESALQQQPEPVALKDGVPNTEAAIAYALERWGYRQGTKECIAFYRGACWCVLAAAPSTPEKAGGEKACAACKWPLSPCTCPAGVKGGQRG